MLYDKTKAKYLLGELKKIGVNIGLRTREKSDIEFFKEFIEFPNHKKKIN
jgi:hypothetical protein